MKINNSAEIRRRIDELKRRKRAVILAHYYTTPEVQEAADFLGDSLALSVKAQSVDADIILFAGVHFMADTAKVLCHDNKVLIHCPEESGILAEMKKRYPGKTFIPAPPDDETCGCNDCKYMKMVTLENICACLENESPEIVLDEEVRRRAERSILNMINIK